MLKTKVRVVDTTSLDSTPSDGGNYSVQVKLWWLPILWITHETDVPSLRQALINAHKLIKTLDPKQTTPTIPVAYCHARDH